MNAMTKASVEIQGGSFLVARWPEDAGDLAGARLQLHLYGGTTGKHVRWGVSVVKPGTTTRWYAERDFTYTPDGAGHTYDADAMLAQAGVRGGWDGGTEGAGKRLMGEATLKWFRPLVARMAQEAGLSVRAWLADPMTSAAAELASAKGWMEANQRTVTQTERHLAAQRERLAEATARFELAMARYREVEAGG